LVLGSFGHYDGQEGYGFGAQDLTLKVSVGQEEWVHTECFGQVGLGIGLDFTSLQKLKWMKNVCKLGGLYRDELGFWGINQW
jgi:hypothetical protein